MSAQQITPNTISFGPFEADLHTREVKKHGQRLRLPGQSFLVLQMLLERPGQLVTREELQQSLWPSDTHVDFERGVNAAVNRLRDVLGDSAEDPTLIETLPRRGYRFIGTVSQPQPPLTAADPPIPVILESSAAAAPPVESTAHQDKRASSRSIALKILAAVLVAAVASLVVAFFFRKPPRNSVTLTPLPFTTLQGNELNPAFSPDGSQIVFAWNGDPLNAGQGFDLYLKVVGSEELLRLTHHPVDAIEGIFPAWSPDGAQIAFHRIESHDQSGIFVIPALGGAERRLRTTTSPDGNTFTLSWSSDGKRLAFVDSAPSGEDSRIYFLSLDTLEARSIPHLPECRSEWFPAFSHDGQHLSYLCWRGQQEFALYSLALTSNTSRPVTVFSGWPYGLAWSTDDKRIILSRYLASSGGLDEISLADGVLRKLPFKENSRTPAIAPRGDRLAYSSFSSNKNIWRRDLRHPELPPAKLISSSREQISAQYSPDGRHIAFESTRTGFREIWMTDFDGAHPVQLTKLNDAQTGSPRWSPDSQKIAFDSRGAGHPEIYLLDISERIPRRLDCNLQDMSLPSWSNDAKWIYFVGKDPVVYRCPSTGGIAEPLTSKSQPLFPLEFFDAQKILFSTFLPDSTVYQVSLKHPGEESPVPGMPVLADNSLWALTSEGIYFIPKDVPHSLRYYDFATAKTRLILNIDKNLEDGLSVSPDGRWVIYAQTDQLNADIMLVDNFK